jgi:hypothetical protein
MGVSRSSRKRRRRKAYDTNVNGKMEDKLITFHRVCIGHCSAHARPPPHATLRALPTSTATPTPTPVTPSDSMFSGCHPVQTFVHHLCIVVRCIFHVKTVLENTAN